MISAHPNAGAVIFVLLAALSAMLAFFSSAVLLPVVVPIWGERLTACLLWAGRMLGGACAYGLGRYLGRPLVRALVPSRHFDAYADRISRTAPFGVILLLQAALPSEVPGYLFGLARVPVRRYLAALAIAELPYAVVTVWIGESIASRHVATFLVAMSAVVAVGLIAMYLLRRRMSR